MTRAETDSMFSVESTSVEIVPGQPYEVKSVKIKPEALEGFDARTIGKPVIACILSHTINGMLEHGDVALGLDLGSRREVLESSGRLLAIMGVGADILTELSPRTDGANWNEWLRDTFPQAVAEIHGTESQASQIAQTEMGLLDFTP